MARKPGGYAFSLVAFGRVTHAAWVARCLTSRMLLDGKLLQGVLVMQALQDEC